MPVMGMILLPLYFNKLVETIQLLL
jgi:hypothetical protein